MDKFIKINASVINTDKTELDNYKKQKKLFNTIRLLETQVQDLTKRLERLENEQSIKSR